MVVPSEAVKFQGSVLPNSSRPISVSWGRQADVKSSFSYRKDKRLLHCDCSVRYRQRLKGCFLKVQRRWWHLLPDLTSQTSLFGESNGRCFCNLHRWYWSRCSRHLCSIEEIDSRGKVLCNCSIWRGQVHDIGLWIEVIGDGVVAAILAHASECFGASGQQQLFTIRWITGASHKTVVDKERIDSQCFQIDLIERT